MTSKLVEFGESDKQTHGERRRDSGGGSAFSEGAVRIEPSRCPGEQAAESRRRREWCKLQHYCRDDEQEGLMEADASVSWLIAGTIAAVVSASAAAASAVWSGLALRSQARAVDVSSYLEVLERLQRFERVLRASASLGEEHVFARREYLNFIEGLAHLYMKGGFGNGTANLCMDALCNSIAAVEINAEIMEILENSLTSPETFEYLGKFRKKYRDVIERRKIMFRATGAQDTYVHP